MPRYILLVSLLSLTLTHQSQAQGLLPCPEMDGIEYMFIKARLIQQGQALSCSYWMGEGKGAVVEGRCRAKVKNVKVAQFFCEGLPEDCSIKAELASAWQCQKHPHNH